MSLFRPTLNAQQYPHAIGKIVCVGLNYADHAAEMKSTLPTEPLLFIKPATAAADLAQTLKIPAQRGAVHHELELAILIGAPLSNATETDCLAAIVGVGLAIDLTLRDIQAQLKRAGQPWERSKGFDGAYPMSAFIAPTDLDLQNLTLQLRRNGELQQNGNTADMLFPIAKLIADISCNFSLLPGDIVSTGTPAGVGPLHSGDVLIATLGHEVDGQLIRVETKVA